MVAQGHASRGRPSWRASLGVVAHATQEDDDLLRYLLALTTCCPLHKHTKLNNHSETNPLYRSCRLQLCVLHSTSKPHTSIANPELSAKNLKRRQNASHVQHEAIEVIANISTCLNNLMRFQRAPTASQIQNPPPPTSSTKTGRLFGRTNLGA